MGWWKVWENLPFHAGLPYSQGPCLPGPLLGPGHGTRRVLVNVGEVNERRSE